MQRHHILMRELENGVTHKVNQKFHCLVSILYATASLKAVLPLIMLTHLVRSHAFYVLILHGPMEHWILSLTTIINSCCHVLQVHCVDWPAVPSLGRVVLLLATTQIIIKTVTMNCTVSKLSRSAAQVSPATIRILSQKNFDLELKLINAGLVWLPVSFSSQGEKLLERNKHPGHNLRLYSIQICGHSQKLMQCAIICYSNNMM